LSLVDKFKRGKKNIRFEILGLFLFLNHQNKLSLISKATMFPIRIDLETTTNKQQSVESAKDSKIHFYQQYRPSILILQHSFS